MKLGTVLAKALMYLGSQLITELMHAGVEELKVRADNTLDEKGAKVVKEVLDKTEFAIKHKAK